MLHHEVRGGACDVLHLLPDLHYRTKVPPLKVDDSVVVTTLCHGGRAATPRLCTSPRQLIVMAKSSSTRSQVFETLIFECKGLVHGTLITGHFQLDLGKDGKDGR